MKNSYKKYGKIYIGSSDIASLTLRTWNKAATLDFNVDGEYEAYLVDENAEIGAHYDLVFSCENWLRIYDDFELTRKLKGSVIKIYRAGDFGCIIQVIN